MQSSVPESVVRPIRLTEPEIRFYKAEGYLTVPGLIEPAGVDALREEVLDVLEANGLTRASMCKATRVEDKLRQFQQYLEGSALDRLINGPSMLAVASQLVEGRAVRYLPFTAVKLGGGGGAFDYHQDNNYTNHDPAMGSINIWVALNDMTPENGCLRMVPRSHLAGQWPSRAADDGTGHRQVDVDPMQCVPIRMRAGDAVAFSRWTVHGSGPNLTEQPRIAYALQYHRDDVKWLDKSNDQWRLLVETPRFATLPVKTLGPA